MVLPCISRATAALLLILCASGAATAAVFVDCDAPSGGNGTSWETAFRSIKSGLSAATTANNEVWVAEGIYVENITLRSGMRLYGGFEGTETSRDERSPSAHETVIDGNQAGNTVVGMDNALLDGFTIRNGKPVTNGGGVYCSYTSPTISNCRITGNAGSGVFCNQSTPAIIGCEITDNTNKGVYCYFGGNATITDCTIARNSAEQYAGLHCNSARPTIRRCIVADNETTGTSAYGGGLAFTSCALTVTVENCLIAGNRAAMGAGVFCSMSSPSFVNCTIADNTADENGANVYLIASNAEFRNTIIAFGAAPTAGGIVKNPTDLPTFTNCDFYENGSAPFDPSDWNPRLDTSCTSMDPLFADRTGGDYHLTAPSHCVDGGTNASAPGDDLDGNSRPSGDRCDIGAYEFQPAAPLDTVVEVKMSPDGEFIAIENVVVTRAFDGFFYIEQQDRTAGIRVQWSEPVPAGRLARVSGTLGTHDGVERQIAAANVHVGADPVGVEPIGMVTRSLPGRDLVYSAGPPATGQMGAPGGYGPNNVGLLVRTWGSVIPEADGIRLNDGSSTHPRVILPEGMIPPAEGSFVRVTGISSIEMTPGGPASVILASEVVPIE